MVRRDRSLLRPQDQRGPDREATAARRPTTRPTSSPTSRRRDPPAAAKPKPFFLWLTYFARTGQPREADDPPGLGTPVARRATRARSRRSRCRSRRRSTRPDVSDKPAAVRNRPPLGPDNIAALTSSYRQRLESLLAVDEGVARVVAALRSAGVLENTLIVFTSDNGFLQGEHRVIDGKQLVYEPSVRVPLVMRAGRAARRPPRRRGVDLAPTIAGSRRLRPRIEDGRCCPPRRPAEWGRDITRARAERRRRRRRVHGSELAAMCVEYSSGERELYDPRTTPTSSRTQATRRARRSGRARRELWHEGCSGPTGQLAPAPSSKRSPPALRREREGERRRRAARHRSTSPRTVGRRGRLGLAAWLALARRRRRGRSRSDDGRRSLDLRPRLSGGPGRGANRPPRRRRRRAFLGGSAAAADRWRTRPRTPSRGPGTRATARGGAGSATSARSGLERPLGNRQRRGRVVAPGRGGWPASLSCCVDAAFVGPTQKRAVEP